MLVARQPEHAIAVGLRVGLALGLVTAIAGAFTPFIEWTADHLPERRMGVFGIGLILMGFTTAIRPVLGGAARCDRSLGRWNRGFSPRKF